MTEKKIISNKKKKKKKKKNRKFNYKRQQDQATLMECDQMWIILQYNLPCSPHTSSISIAVLGSHWSKNSSRANITSSYKLFSPLSYFMFDLNSEKKTVEFPHALLKKINLKEQVLGFVLQVSRYPLPQAWSSHS